jgi:hypothetical protein
MQLTSENRMYAIAIVAFFLFMILSGLYLRMRFIEEAKHQAKVLAVGVSIEALENNAQQLKNINRHVVESYSDMSFVALQGFVYPNNSQLNELLRNLVTYKLVELHIAIFKQMQGIYALLETVFGTDELGAAKPEEINQLKAAVKKLDTIAEKCVMQASSVYSEFRKISILVGNILVRNRTDELSNRINIWCEAGLEYTLRLQDIRSNCYEPLFKVLWATISKFKVEIPDGKSIVESIRGTPELRRPILDALSRGKTDLDAGLQILASAAVRPSGLS